MKYKTIVIGVDQSYTRSGLSIAADNQLLKVGSEAFKGCKNKTEKRQRLAQRVGALIEKALTLAERVVVICERIRLKSAGMISIAYMKATGALIGIVVDTAYTYGVPVYSVDTRSWKAQIVGTTKAQNGDKKLPTILYVKCLGFEQAIKTVGKDGNIKWDDDAADSACMALYGFLHKSKRKLNREE